jgi:glycosyltransferase involved in cell wall biosynthesis
MTQNRAFASVVMPTYNVAPFVTAAVRSVLVQSHERFELLVVDDGSTDGTVDCLRSIDDPRLRLLSQVHSGSSAARNRGISAASGQYIAFIDGDDMWRPTKLEKHISVLEQRPDIDLTFSRSDIIDENGAVTGRRSKAASGDIGFADLVVENVIANGSSVVMRRVSLDQAGWFDVHLDTCVDLDLWLRVARLRHHNIASLDEPLTLYRMRSGQITKDWKRIEASWLAIFDRLPWSIEDRRLVERRAKANLYRYLAYIAYETGDASNAWSLFRRAWSHAADEIVTDRRAWVLLGALMSTTFLPRSWHVRFEASIKRGRATTRGKGRL